MVPIIHHQPDACPLAHPLPTVSPTVRLGSVGGGLESRPSKLTVDAGVQPLWKPQGGSSGSCTQTGLRPSTGPQGQEQTQTCACTCMFTEALLMVTKRWPDLEV